MREDLAPERSPDKQYRSSGELACGEESDGPAASTRKRWRWSIGIYTGDSPLCLSPPPEIRNPVLTYKDVSDVHAVFVADPFMVVEEGTWYMFFEVMNGETGKGEIGLAVSDDGLRWEYRQIVLKEPFHLSYPYVFRWKGDYYMIPETLALNCIQLYRAVTVPTEWSRVRTLIDGQCADSSVFRFDSKWWMLTCTTPHEHDTLRLYQAAELMGPWREHPKSPIVEGNKRIARPGGRVTLWDGRLFRMTQDCYPGYGSQVRAVEIVDLTPTTYSEEEAAASQVLFTASDGWNCAGMHHVDPRLTPQGKWIACVDGFSML